MEIKNKDWEVTTLVSNMKVVKNSFGWAVLEISTENGLWEN